MAETVEKRKWWDRPLRSVRYGFELFYKWCSGTWNLIARGLIAHIRVVCCITVVILTAWMFVRGTILIVADHQITKYQTIVLCVFSLGWVAISCFAIAMLTRKDEE